MSFQGAKIGSENIIFTDKDSISVNSNISYEVLNDTLEMIHPVCNAYENDQLGLKSTVISCSKYAEKNNTKTKISFDFPILELNFLRNGILSLSPYCFGLSATDPTVDIAHNFVFKSVSQFEFALSVLNETNLFTHSLVSSQDLPDNEC